MVQIGEGNNNENLHLSASAKNLGDKQIHQRYRGNVGDGSPKKDPRKKQGTPSDNKKNGTTA